MLLWPVSALIRGHYGRSSPLTPDQSRLRLLVRLACLAYLIFIAAYGIYFSLALKDIGMLSPRYNFWIRLIQFAGWLGIRGTFAALYNAFRAWQEPGGWVWSRISETVIAIACLGVLWFAVTWNLLNWSLKF